MSRAQLWSDQHAIPEEKLRARKTALLVIIAITSLLPLLAVTPDDAPLKTNVFKYLAKTGAFLGSMFMLWQFLLGFRGVVSRIFPDLSWVTTVHKRLGQFGVPIILLHPIFIALYYVETEGQNIYALDLSTRFSQFVLLGIVLLAVVAFVVIVSLVRAKIPFYPWLYTHLSAYLVPPFLFIHSFSLGQTIQGSWLKYYWWFWTAVMVAMFIFRAAHKMGATSSAYTVTSSREVATDTTEILMTPDGRGVEPAPGQFVYVRESARHNSHPYSVSALDGDTLGVTVSKAGPQSAAMQEVEPGDRFLVDGGYGVFTRPAMATDLPTVMIAGGVGITAFRRLWQRLEEEKKREAWMFYGNETFDQIAYRDELDALSHVKVVHVLNDEDEWEGETGFVDADLLSRNLPEDLKEYQFLICGPPPMVLKLMDGLAEAGVPDSRIREELFSA